LKWISPYWNESAERAFNEVVTGPHSDASLMLRAMRDALSENDVMASPVKKPV